MQIRSFVPFLLLLCAGCGGSGSGVETATPSVIVDWPDRTRNFSAGSSAQSVKIVLHNTSGTQADVEIDGNRSNDLIEHSETYKYTRALLIGDYTVNVSFYSQPDQAGPVTATSSSNVALFSCGCLESPNGSPLGTVVFNSSIKSVTMPFGQSVEVGGTVQLTASALDANGNMVAVTPGSYFFQVTSGFSHASSTPDGVLSSSSPGNVTVTAIVDGVTSPATVVSVNGD